MSKSTSQQILCPTSATLVSVEVKNGDTVNVGQPLVVLESMKMMTTITSPVEGQVHKVAVQPQQHVEAKGLLLEITGISSGELSESESTEQTQHLGTKLEPLEQLNTRKHQTLDDNRIKAAEKRHAKGFRTARENLVDLCDQDSFQEYGQFAVAAQRGRKPYEELKSSTAADGIITGVATVNREKIEENDCRVAIAINDYSVLAGTQGYYHHLKLDRILDTAKCQKLPVIMYTEGGGGRPGDTDITTVNSGLNCKSFASWASLKGLVPRISVNNGYCFAGNAALFGAADITIATKQSYIGMAGPAMIEGGGLGQYPPTAIGPIDIQSKNGVVDIVADDEAQATQFAKQAVSYFQGPSKTWQEADQATMRSALPEDRRFAYDVHPIIHTLADTGSFLELKKGYGGAVITGLLRIKGIPLGIMANNCKVLGGAIDVEAGQKAAQFMQLCNDFSLPLVSLCDTPGFMVGPEHEELGAVRRLSDMFVAGAQLNVPLVGVVLRKCYGLGAQAMLGGSTSTPVYTVSWPQGEFGPMGLEGAVKLGFKKELDAQTDPQARQGLYNKLLQQQYQRGQAIEVASTLEIDAVIDPAQTRNIIAEMI